MKSIRELLKMATSKIPILDAELLLVYVLNQSGLDFDRIKLLTKLQYLPDEQTAERFLKLIDERSKGKPVQYIINKQEFMNLELYVAEGVLIPRPDTEIVVEKVIRLAEGIEKPVIIDMCTGSGAIAVSLARNVPGARVWAVDVSDSAIDCCSINVNRFKFENSISVVKSDLFANIMDEGLVGNTDIIVSNPPYIESSVIHRLDVNVRDYEPHMALDGGKDGLLFYRRIVKDSVEFLKGNGILAFEVGYDQGDKVKNIMEESDYYYDLNVEKDLAGYNRCVWGYKTL